MSSEESTRNRAEMRAILLDAAASLNVLLAYLEDPGDFTEQFDWRLQLGRITQHLGRAGRIAL